MQAKMKTNVRDRILNAASQLFYHCGIRAVSVDTLVKEAGTNKTSFYRCFESKDELVATHLRIVEQHEWRRWDETLANHDGNPRAQIEKLFYEMATTSRLVDKRGCAMTNAAVEITDQAHPAFAIIQQFKSELRRRFRALAEALHAREPKFLGDALMLLWEGSQITRITFGENGPARAAMQVATTLILATPRTVLNRRGC
jgi:AcrR family transcriptional regulator